MSVVSVNYFSEDYPAARQRFLAAGHALGADLHQLRLGLSAPDGSPLTIDIAWIGARSPDTVVIHSSGLHGIEGFAGSAIQLALMNQCGSIPPNGAILFVHTLNPFGMAWLRRFNENNVDLNRNFLPAGVGRPTASEAYRRLEKFLNPGSPPG
jgi:predicted deacylase